MQVSDGEHGGRAGGEKENDQRDEMVRDEKGGVRSVGGWRRGKGSERVHTARSFIRSMCVIHATAIKLIPFRDAGSPVPSCYCPYTFGSCFVRPARYSSFKCALGTRIVLTDTTARESVRWPAVSEPFQGQERARFRVHFMHTESFMRPTTSSNRSRRYHGGEDE
jgi:hypothetical protein